MKIIHETITLEINGMSFDAVISGYHYPHFDGGFEEESTPEEFDIQGLEIKEGTEYKNCEDLLNLDFVVKEIIEQIKNG